MSMQEDSATYSVLINAEEQFSLWRTSLPIPDGWRPAGKEGSRQECLAYVESHWTDMRPLSLRKRDSQL